MTSRRSSELRGRNESAVRIGGEKTRSQNNTVTCRRPRRRRGGYGQKPCANGAEPCAPAIGLAAGTRHSTNYPIWNRFQGWPALGVDRWQNKRNCDLANESIRRESRVAGETRVIFRSSEEGSARALAGPSPSSRPWLEAVGAAAGLGGERGRSRGPASRRFERLGEQRAADAAALVRGIDEQREDRAVTRVGGGEPSTRPSPPQPTMPGLG